ncbi:hypothetical protein ADL05_24530 [Nocardiopsis sp. NRRL B-16309]|nr:hypothetical protein ADL05_24530 [Nocardiopsis sp. NRRL B-16309]
MDAPAAGRAWVRSTAQTWGVSGDAIDVLELIASELVTNAVVHTRSHLPLVLALLREHDGTVGVAVRDHGSDDGTAPALGRATDVEHGRGLVLVDALSRAWGARPLLDEHPDRGHLVWALVPGSHPTEPAPVIA